MRVISIDPAPKKQAVVFDGKIQRYTPNQLVGFCRELEQDNNTLLCWDAPLTGPPNPDAIEVPPFAYSQRFIEQFFARKETGYKAPAGISVLPYSGCPHWTISRASIGLPRLGRFDFTSERLPFQLVHDTAAFTNTGNFVIETHPAVAIWLWCEAARANTDPNIAPQWIYKGKRKSANVISELWPILKREWAATKVEEIEKVIELLEVPKDDDELDAITGWVLGVLIANAHKSVAILGDALTGSFALPVDQDLLNAFDEFYQREVKLL